MLLRILHTTSIWKSPVKCSSGNIAHFSSSWRSQNVGRYNRSATGPNEPLLATRHPHIRPALPVYHDIRKFAYLFFYTFLMLPANGHSGSHICFRKRYLNMTRQWRLLFWVLANDNRENSMHKWNASIKRMSSVLQYSMKLWKSIKN